MPEDLSYLKNCKRIAVMGGTFDPIHLGHLVTAETVRCEYGLDKVIFVPTGNPPHKNSGKTSDSEHRRLMCVLATVNNPFFAVSRIETDRRGMSYTVDTLRELRGICGKDMKIYFITGADAVSEILEWKDAGLLLTLCSFIAVTRPGYDEGKLRDTVEKIKEHYKSRLHFLQVPALAISSTDIRNRISAGRTVKYLVPDEVEKYILKTDLYAAEASVPSGREEIIGRLKNVLSEKRYIHTLNVAELAVKLAAVHGADGEKALLAGLLHDCAKCLTDAEMKKLCKEYGIKADKIHKENINLIHSFVGAEIAKRKYGVRDGDVLNAIRYHTTGRGGMSLLEKIICVADYTEPGREFHDGLDEIRETAYNNLDKALYMCIESAVGYNIKKGKPIIGLSYEVLKEEPYWTSKT